MRRAEDAGCETDPTARRMEAPWRGESLELAMRRLLKGPSHSDWEMPLAAEKVPPWVKSRTASLRRACWPEKGVGKRLGLHRTGPVNQERPRPGDEA